MNNKHNKIRSLLLILILFVLLPFSVDRINAACDGQAICVPVNTICLPEGCIPNVNCTSCTEECPEGQGGGYTLINCGYYTDTGGNTVCGGPTEWCPDGFARCSAADSCSDDILPTTPPETCTDPAPITVPEIDCTQKGFLGKYSGDRGIYAVNYLCDPDSSKGTLKEVCSGWSSTWDGYWNVAGTASKTYEFNVVYNPVLRFRINMEPYPNTSFTADSVRCPASPQVTSGHDPSVGDYFFFLATGCTACRQNMYRPSWLTNSSARYNNPLSYVMNGAGTATCERLANSTGKGIHLEKVDVNTLDQDGSCGEATAPVPVPAKYQGTEECPIAALTTDGALDNIKSDQTDSDWLSEGSGHSFFTRTLSPGSHRISIYYSTNGANSATPYLDIYYREVGSSTWIALKDLSDDECPVSACPPSCTLSLTPATKSMVVGGTQAFTATLSNVSGTVSNVAFTRSGTAISVSPASDTTSPYVTTATAANTGSPVITASAYIGGSVACTDTSKVTVTASAVADPWWQVMDGDVISKGDLITNVIGALRFLLPGDGGYPGLSWYGGNGTSDLTTTTVSDEGWLSQSNFASNRVFNSAYFFDATPSGTIINRFSDSSISDGDIETGGTLDSSGYRYYAYNGNDFGGAPLTIDDADGVRIGTRKIIIFVENADVNINKTINLTDNSGFFLLVTTGNINIDPEVGDETAEPDLEGIYIADGRVNTGTGGLSNDARLFIRGTVVAGGRINLERNRGTDNTTLPSEYIEYAIDQELLFPKDLSYTPMKWQEVAP